MKMRGEPCGCITRFMNQFPRTEVKDLNGLKYEDETCYVECTDGNIRAYAYEIIGSSKYRIGECVMSIW